MNIIPQSLLNTPSGQIAQKIIGPVAGAKSARVEQ